MRRIPAGIHLNDEPALREMLGIDRPHKLPESTLGIYQRVARYGGVLSTATMVNIPGALLTIAWHVEEIEAKRLGCKPDEFAEKYNAEQKTILDKAKAEADARNKAAIEAARPKDKHPVGAK